MEKVNWIGVAENKETRKRKRRTCCINKRNKRNITFNKDQIFFYSRLPLFKKEKNIQKHYRNKYMVHIAFSGGKRTLKKE